MATYYTTDSLIDAIKLKGMIPTHQSTITTDNFITFINEEMDLGVLPHILTFHENNLTRSKTVAVTSGETRYAIPSRAVGNKLKDVYLLDSSGNLKELTRVSDGDLADFNSATEGYPGAFYLEGDSIVLLFTPNTTDSIKFIYHCRPNRLVKEERASYITNITGGAITLSSMPTAFTTSLQYDFIKSTSPHSCLAIDLTPTTILGNVITFSASDIPTTLKVGDYVNIAEETIIPQVPPELHGLLAQRVVARCLEALGDQAGLQAANAKIGELEVKTGALIDNRVENAPQKVKNRWGVLSRRRNWW